MPGERVDLLDYIYAGCALLADFDKNEEGGLYYIVYKPVRVGGISGRPHSKLMC